LIISTYMEKQDSLTRQQPDEEREAESRSIFKQDYLSDISSPERLKEDLNLPPLKARQVGNQIQVSGFKDFDQMTRLIEFFRLKGISPTKVLRLFDRVGSIIVNLKSYNDTIVVRNLLS
jgi:hypothetical protein